MARAVCFAVVVGLTCMVAPAWAAPIQIGQFFYDDFDGVGYPTFHVVNDSANPFSFVLTLDTIYGPMEKSDSAAPGAGFQTADFVITTCADASDPLTCGDQALFVDDMRAATLSDLSIPGLSGVFLFSATGDPSAAAAGFGMLDVLPILQSETLSIYFDQDIAQDPGPVPVPEPSTLLLLGTGVAAVLRRRATRLPGAR